MKLVDDLLAFLHSSPTPFHAVRSLSKKFENAGFTRLAEEDVWKVRPGAKHYVVRDGSAIAAFVAGKKAPAESGFRLVGSHTDSPCLKVKPAADVFSVGFHKIGVEVYGSMLLGPWFDRDLSLAGRVVYRDKKGAVSEALVNFERAIATVPNLAIHLQRDVNEGRAIQRQLELPPILAQTFSDDDRTTLDAALLDELSRGGIVATKILAHDLSFYDTQAPAVVGFRKEFIASARLDNLASCFSGARALCESTGEAWRIFVANDHEEVGSVSSAGAAGPFLRTLIDRLMEQNDGGAESTARAMRRSLFLSADNAHGIHPNYPDKHEPQHAPRLNLGPAVKVNANQRYATNARGAGVFAAICEDAKVPLQRFVARTDMGCGSTIGPMTAAGLGITVLDVGIPTFAMHSIREMAGVKDIAFFAAALKAFYEATELPVFSAE